MTPPLGKALAISSISPPSFFFIFLATSDVLLLPCPISKYLLQFFLTAATGPHIIVPSFAAPTASLTSAICLLAWPFTMNEPFSRYSPALGVFESCSGLTWKTSAWDRPSFHTLEKEAVATPASSSVACPISLPSALITKNGEPLISVWKTISPFSACFLTKISLLAASLPPMHKNPSLETNHLNFSYHFLSCFFPALSLFSQQPFPPPQAFSSPFSRLQRKKRRFHPLFS